MIIIQKQKSMDGELKSRSIPISRFVFEWWRL